ncbi:MAG: carboxypeptidase-like regulatory domain-containing protein [Planctomycetaceae bacterium]|nr:carboxypeptidase-like regulatory domain-containing protein [Planctomycetaceae bacterium]
MKYALTAGRFCIAVALIPFAGCGGPDNVGSVSGTVTLNGQPLPDAIITFSPTAEGGSSGVGTTDSAGQYTLSYAAGVRGAQEGENMVRITTYREAEPDADPPKPAVPEKVPARYNAKTELKVEVKSGSNTFDFPLEPGPVVQPGHDDEDSGGQAGARGGAKGGAPGGARPRGGAPRSDGNTKESGC